MVLFGHYYSKDFLLKVLYYIEGDMYDANEFW